MAVRDGGPRLWIVLPAGLLAVAGGWWLFAGEEAGPGAGPGSGATLNAGGEPIPESLPSAPQAVETERFTGREPAGSEIPAGDLPLVIETVDPDSRPAPKVPVVLEVVKGRSRIARLWHGETGPGGLVSVPGGRRRLPGVAPGERLAVATDFPAFQPVRVEFDLDTLGPGNLRLSLPPTARVLVTLEGPVPGLVPAVHLVRLWLKDPALSWAAGASATAMFRDGLAEFPHVGLGGELHFQVEPGQWPVSTGSRIAGAQAGGETLRAVLSLRALQCRITFRVVDPNGEPVAAAEVTASLWDDGNAGGVPVWKRSLTADSEGRVQDVLTLDADRPPPTHLRVERRWRDRIFRSRLTGLVERSEAGHYDLGDVSLQLMEDPVQVAGQVVDAAGRPVAGASITFLPTPGADTRAIPRLPVLLSCEEGRFSLRCADVAESVLVSAGKHGYIASRPVRAPAGERNCRLILRREAVLSGSLLVDKGVPPEGFQVRVHPIGGLERNEPDDARTIPLPNGRFQVRAVPPGGCALGIWIPGESGPLHFVDGLLAGEDDLLEDPRLQEIDLRGRVRWARITVRLPDSSVARKGVLRIRPAGSTGAWTQEIRLQGTPVTVLSSGGLLEVRAIVEGCLPADSGPVSEDHTLVLEAGCSLRLSVDPSGAPAPGDLAITIRQAGAPGLPGSESLPVPAGGVAGRETASDPAPGSAPRGFDRLVDPLPSSGEVLIPLPGGGDYRITLLGPPEGADGLRPTLAGRSVHVAERAGVKEVRIRVGDR